MKLEKTSFAGGLILSAVSPPGEPSVRENGIYDLLLERRLSWYFWQLLKASIPHADDLAAQFSRYAAPRPN